MSKKPDQSQDTDQINSFLKYVKLLGYFFALITAAALFIYMVKFGRNGLGNTDQFGQFGDYIGGLLNPSLSFITILLLIWSIRVQMSELSATREELKKSSDALKATQDTHQENLHILKRENFRKQIHDDFKSKIATVEALLNKPLFPIFHPTSNARTAFTLKSYNEVLLLNEAEQRQFIDTSKNHYERGQYEAILATKASILKNIEYLSECTTELYIYLDNNYVALSIHTQVEELVNRCFKLNIIDQGVNECVMNKTSIPERLKD